LKRRILKKYKNLKTDDMRNLLLKLAVLFLFVVYISSCGFTNENNIRGFIPGVYARQFEAEFSKGWDTLTIEPFSGSTYVIAQNVSYQRIEDGKLKKPQRKVSRLTAVYSDKEEVLVENKKGLIISFDPTRNSLMFGRSVYKKIR
jgi:hypothetical protein